MSGLVWKVEPWGYSFNFPRKGSGLLFPRRCLYEGWYWAITEIYPKGPFLHIYGLMGGWAKTREEAMRRVEETLDLVDEY